MAKENNDRESARHKRYYDQKFKCMKIEPGDIVLVRVKAFGPDHKIADRWEQNPYKVLSHYANTPVYKVQPVGAEDDDSIRTLHGNMLFPFQFLREDNHIETQNQALINADIAMMSYFHKLLLRDKQYFCGGGQEVKTIV